MNFATRYNQASAIAKQESKKKGMTIEELKAIVITLNETEKTKMAMHLTLDCLAEQMNESEFEEFYDSL